MAEEHSKCIICRKHLMEIKKEPDPESSQGRQFYYWKKDCAKSICEVLLGTVSLPFVSYFQHGEFCSPCLQTLRDVHFTWKQIKVFEDKINQLTDIVQNNIATNYDCVEQKTSMSVVEKRASVALNVSDKSRNFLDNYSYDEIVEMIYSVSSKLTSHSVSTSYPVISQQGYQPSLPQSISQLYPNVKLELEDNDDNPGTESLPIENMFHENLVECDIAEGLNPSVNKNDSENQNKRRRVQKLETVPKNKQIVDDIDDGISDRDGNISDEFMPSESDSQSEDSWSPVSRQKTNPSRMSSRLSLKRLERSIKIEPVMKSRISISKRSKSKHKLRKKNQFTSKTRKYKCPICFKVIQNQNRIVHERIHTGIKPFSCAECGKSFNFKKRFQGHMRLVHGKLYLDGTNTNEDDAFEAAKVANEFASRKRRYHCDLCSWTFNYTYRYLRHIKDSHLNKDVQDGDTFNFYYCDADNCLHSFTSLTSLKSHITEFHRTDSSKAEQKPSLECCICLRIFVQQNSLEMHMKSHEKNQFGCDYCHLTFSSQLEMEYHKPRHEISFHISSYCHMCEDCGEGFTDLKQLRKHVSNLHSAETPKVIRKGVYNTTNPDRARSYCKICRKALYCTADLQYHMYSHTHPDGFPCSKCPEVKKTPKLLEQHEKRHHHREVNKSGTKRPPRNRSGIMQVCEICGKEVLHLQIHQQIHNNSTLQTCDICGKQVLHLESHKQIHSKVPEFQCSKCDRKMTSIKLLRYHEKRSHPPGEPILPAKYRNSSTKCEVCNKEFAQKSYYRKHIYFNHPEEYKATHPYVCKLCWLVFDKEEDKEYHVNQRHNGYICTFEGCDKKFSQRNRLAAHLNIHYNTKPYLCPFCGKGFANDGNCLSHVHMVHLKHRSLRCKLCPDNEGYYVKKEFIKHVEKVHPKIHPENYKTILEHRKPDVPVKIERSKGLDVPYYPPAVRRLRNPTVKKE